MFPCLYTVTDSVRSLQHYKLEFTGMTENFSVYFYEMDYSQLGPRC